MPHLVLLGDSVFDNGAYVAGEPDVVAQVRELMPADWQVSTCAVDGATSADIPAQLRTLPRSSTHLVLSVGGNDALMRESILHASVSSSAEAFLALADAVDEFEASYRATIDGLLATKLPLIACTIYNGNFADVALQRCVRVAIAAFDDVIARVSAEHGYRLLELRRICTAPEDYANDIEPSVVGGSKMANAIFQLVTMTATPVSTT